jgi:hypothetical protein
MQKLIYYIFLIFILLIHIFSIKTASYGIENYEIQYINQKASANYKTALDILTEWTSIETESIVIEINIFRINELIKYPELIPNAIKAYQKIINNKIVQANPVLEAKIKIFLNRLYLKSGRLQDALNIIADTGFISNYKMNGPFKIDKNRNDEYKNREWFEATVDPSGTINLSDFFSKVNECVFYLETIIYLPCEGVYNLWIGKSGKTDIWINGKKIYTNAKGTVLLRINTGSNCSFRQDNIAFLSEQKVL